MQKDSRKNEEDTDYENNIEHFLVPMVIEEKNKKKCELSVRNYFLSSFGISVQISDIRSGFSKSVSTCFFKSNAWS